jgi:hypothetical protein
MLIYLIILTLLIKKAYYQSKSNNMNKNYLLLVFIILLSNDIKAQHNFCGNSLNSLYRSSFADEPHQKEIMLNKLVSEYMQQNVGHTTSGSTVEIPIVFHIIHEGGPENIADSIIINEVNVLNQRFSNTGNYNYVDGINTNIQFCLASTDPYGNPTTGITRTFSPLTNMPLGGDVDVKNLSRWNPHRYLNVWFVKNCVIAMGSSAYSNFPWMSLITDGIMLTAPTNVISNQNNYTLAHEVGHYFGLYHNNEGNSCLNDNCLLDGDRVCDTPPEFQPALCNGNTCNTDMDDTSGFNPFTMDMNDISNIMMPIV